ncbi:CoA transferase [Sphingobium sp. EM0848]|uniref:CaiB/BaiF CoA-transferase family protein n=1 Tax=Sphingobium sp. EM0848 TaxID=2743473 RepID=UPI00159C8F87|nr:CoA transferase [Sphingobium sp. EM0848]
MNEAGSYLKGLKVLDLGSGMAAALVAKFLADAGAEVWRVPPVGDVAYEALYPAYRTWHAGGHLCGMDDRETLLASADLCLIGGEDHPDVTPFTVDASSHPRLITIRIDGNPPDMEGAGRPSSEFLAQALSGLAFEHYPDRPLAMAFAPANIGAAFQALLGGLAALIERESSGLGQVVRTSLLEGAISWLPMFWMDIEKPTPAAAFITPKDAMPLIFQCADGQFLHLVIGAAGSKYKLYRLLGIDDPTVLPGDSGMPRPGGDPRNFYGDIDLIASRCALWQRDALLQALWAEGLPAEPVLAPGACWDDPQIIRNGVIVRHAEGVDSVGLPMRATRTAAGKPRPLPVGQRPLEGIRVVDFGAYVAGPLASQLLTGLGADVVKVEPPSGDPSRGLIRGYIASNRGKRGIALDLKDREGLNTAQSLAVDAHIVTSNFRSGVSHRLGIDAETLASLQPDLIILESPAYGSDGPSAQRAGFDMVMQAVTGLEQRAGIEIRRGAKLRQPLWNRLSMVDFAAGTLGAIGLLCALYARRRDGGGSRMEMPLINAGLFLLSELIRLPDGQFAGADPINDSGTAIHPREGFYPARDGWIALSARGEKVRHALSAMTGLAEPTQAAIGAMLAPLSMADAIAMLRDAGIGAEICVRDGEARMLGNEALAARGMVRISDHPVMGRMKDLGPCFSLSRSPLGNYVPLHGVGEHDAEILAEQAARRASVL